jgi:hypothetical protein
MAKGDHQGVSEQSKAAKHRRDDAQVLFHGERWRGAMYLAGYSVECLLKAKLMRKFRCRHLRELEEELQRRGLLASTATVFTHQLEALIALSGGWDRLRRNARLWRQFQNVNRWMPAWRYTADLSDEAEASEFLIAVDAVRRWIQNNV